MDKNEFLKNLNRALRKLNSAERKGYIIHYEELISDMTESGMSESEAVAKQGRIEEIAEEILNSVEPGQLRRTDKAGIVWVALSAVMLTVSVFCLVLYQKQTIVLSTTGGADGPTSVFLAAKVGDPARPVFVYMITIFFIIAAGIHFYRMHKKDNKK